MKPPLKFKTLLPTVVAMGACVFLVFYLDEYDRKRAEEAYHDKVQSTAAELADAINSADAEEREVEKAIAAWTSQNRRCAAKGTFKWQRGGTLAASDNVSTAVKDRLAKIKNLNEWKSPGVKSPRRGLMEFPATGNEDVPHFVLWARTKNLPREKSAKAPGDVNTVRGVVYTENPVEEPIHVSRAVPVGLLSVVFIIILAVEAWIYSDESKENRRRAEEEQFKNKQKTENFNNVSHELSNEVQPITLWNDMLLHGIIKTEADRMEAYETIHLQCDRVNRSIGKLLDYCRLEQNRRSYKLENLDAGRAVQEAARAERPNLEQNGLAVETRIEEGLRVFAEHDALCQILTNLLGNAAKYAPNSGVVEVTAKLNGERVEFTVADRGPGIPKEKAARIFEQFYRAVDSLATSVKGLGLGLAISRGFARGMGGDLVYAPREGGGSVFTLSLPREA